MNNILYIIIFFLILHNIKLNRKINRVHENFTVPDTMKHSIFHLGKLAKKLNTGAITTFGNITIGGNLKVNGTTEFVDNLKVKNITSEGDIKMDKTVRMSNHLTVNKNIMVEGIYGAHVHGDALSFINTNRHQTTPSEVTIPAP